MKKNEILGPRKHMVSENSWQFGTRFCYEANFEDFSAGVRLLLFTVPAWHVSSGIVYVVEMHETAAIERFCSYFASYCSFVVIWQAGAARKADLLSPSELIFRRL